MNKDNIIATIKSVGDLLIQKSLTIPTYQRPYRWQDKNVTQLLDDILLAKRNNKDGYRIGSVILHKHTDTLNIVDGQQRITTICILFTKYKHAYKKSELPNLTYSHIESQKNILNNSRIIENWVDTNLVKESDKGEYIKFILENCNFVEIVVSNESEAFQMFDSQNGTGKELEAYNLLKAYHIRAMELDSQDTKIECDRRWEGATCDPVGKDILKQIFSEQLYRTRVWSNNEDAWQFSKQSIDEFKGLTIDKDHLIGFPYQNEHLLRYLTGKFYDNILKGTTSTKNRFHYGEPDNINPFVTISQYVINGKPFFEYIETYVEIYKRLFIELESNQLKKFKTFYNENCLNYKGSYRSGDKYLREAYKSLIFAIFDKFGEEAVEKFHEVIYVLIYKHRLEKVQVKYSFVVTVPRKYFVIIRQAKSLSDLSALNKELPSNFNKSMIKKEVGEIMSIFNKFYKIKE